MRFAVNVFLFLILIGFCFYWFNDTNPDKNDPSKIPVVGTALSFVSEKYTVVDYYVNSGQGNLWDYVENSAEVRDIAAKFKQIWAIAKGQYQP